MKHLLIMLLLFAATAANAINLPCDSLFLVEDPEDDFYYDVTEEPAEFLGGTKAFSKFIKDNLQYPKAERDAMIEGRVIVSFIIDTLGCVTDIKIARSSKYENFDKEALRLCSIMPNWTPAKVGGRKVSRRINIPVTFKLSNVDKRIHGKQTYDKEPKFPGGNDAFFAWMNENLKQNNQIKYDYIAVLPVQFTINRDGSVCNVHIREQARKSLHPEITRLLSSMPKWKPATLKGEPVRSSVDMNIYVDCDDDRKLSIVDYKSPEFKGGIAALMDFLSDVIEYPEEALKARIEGRPFISFFVETNGKVSDVTVFKSSGNMQLDEEAMRAVQRSSRKWKPGTIGGKKTRMQLYIPVLFRLE